MGNTTELLPVRTAAKAIIVLPNQEYLLVAGESGRLNLVGGGIGVGSHTNPFWELLREADEEAGLTRKDVVSVSHLGVVEGVVVPNQTDRFLARWVVYGLRLSVNHSDITIPKSSEIRSVVQLTCEEVMNQSNISALARTAISRWPADRI